jgi:hypothetical protein
MARRCCCLGCEIVVDDFDRADNTNLGGNWTELTGAWEIKDNRIQETTGSGKAITTASNPYNVQESHASVNLIDIKAGTIYRLLINYNTPTDYLWGEYTWDGGATADLSVGSGVGAAWETVQVPAPVLGGVPAIRTEGLSLCRSRDGLNANVDSDATTAWKCNIPDNNGRKAGLEVTALGSGVTEAIFDDFAYLVHWISDPDCPICPCDCQEACMPHRVEMTFVVGDGLVCDCGALGGTTSTSARIEEAGDKQYDIDFASLPTVLPLASSCVAGNPCNFRLLCPANEENAPEDWILEQGGSPWHGYDDHTPDEEHGWRDDDTAVPDPARSTCDPFFLVFGPFDLDVEDECGYEIHFTPVYD